MAAEVWSPAFPERVAEVAGKIGGGASMERRDRIVRLAEEALGRAAKDLAASKSALLGGATGQDARLTAGEACDALELCCDRLLLVDLLLDPTTHAPVPGADVDGNGNVQVRAAADGFADGEGTMRIRVADALEKAMAMAEDCALLARLARQDAFGAPAT
ncbi:hypothetical protein QYE76_030594 [Lolium multiflorum]|uniref:Uncharacterized protein n=1 Tax=Lolium multiflorum TaxID=4521 RepID=A0AAD8VJE1_LOLMU|nr:hypothetical protein QYE76_030593 [Lolium multiflorum]KAK1606921.1 hypothetical protein QYE76_030594 [Lolium multiflorum]